MDFEPLALRTFARTGAKSQDTGIEGRFWRSFRASPVTIKSYATIAAVHFSPTAPHRYAVTSGSRIQIYSPKTAKVVKTISRFKQTARSGRLRDDGKLIVAGDDAGLVQIFDVNSRAILRTIRAHNQPVRRTLFSPGAGAEATILTASDDATVRLFDIATAEEKACFEGHVDYVRAASYVPSHPALALSGSYDGTVKLWDSRAPAAETMSFEHGYPVEDVLVHPSGTIAVSAGGPLIRVWDLLAGRPRCIKALSNHQKTVTCLTWDGAHRRVLSAGLDGLVKVYDAAEGSWRVGHTMRYGGQITSLAISPTDTHLVVGSADGTLSIRRREAKASETRDRQRQKELLRSGAYESFISADAGTSQVHVGLAAAQPAFGGDDAEVKVKRKKSKRLKEWDRLLKSFRYSDALDAVLAQRNNQLPGIAFALLLELIHRDGLHQALAGRDDVGLEPVLRFLLKHVTDPRYGVTICDVAGVVIGSFGRPRFRHLTRTDMYSSVLGQSALVDGLFRKLRTHVDEEIEFQRELLQVRGQIDMVLAANAALAS